MLEKLDPKELWDIFENIILKTPHCSFHEQKLAQNIEKWVKEQQKALGMNLRVIADENHNLFIKVPATAGYEHYPSVLLQGHLDMVCVANEPFDFNTMPLRPIIQADGKWIEAENTSLGADNGIGLALCLALITLPPQQFQHGPLEILFTVEEETGLGGIMRLNRQKLHIESKFMINVDSGKIGIITVGNAGGQRILASKSLKPQQLRENDDLKYYTLEIGGLKGGHSGVEIDKPNPSAIRIASRIITKLNTITDIYLVDWNGGKKMNAIPRRCEVKFGVSSAKAQKVEKNFEIERMALIKNYVQKGREIEPNMQIKLRNSPKARVYDKVTSNSIISMINLIPSGVLARMAFDSAQVETSLNIGHIAHSETQIRLDILVRSIRSEEIEEIRHRIEQIAFLTDFEVHPEPPFPEWTPNLGSPFLKHVTKKYEQEIQNEVKYYVIHGGLETGVLAKMFPEMEIVAFGPDIENPHTTKERVRIKSVETIFTIIQRILQNMHEVERIS